MCRTGGSAGPDKTAVQYQAVDLGLQYDLTGDLCFGLNLRNLFGFALNDRYQGFSLPRYATLGLSLRRGSWTFTLDSEFIFGRFGGKTRQTAHFWIWRAGAEVKIREIFRLRAGLIYPAAARTSGLGDLKAALPEPGAGAALGGGVLWKNTGFDLAVFGDPAASYVEQKPVLGATITLHLRF